MSAHSLPDTCFGAYAIAKTSITINTASPSARPINCHDRQTVNTDRVKPGRLDLNQPRVCGPPVDVACFRTPRRPVIHQTIREIA